MCTFLTVFLACPVGVWAAGNGETGSGVPVWLCIPFAGLLLCVAVMPLVKGEWWESHQPVVVAFWIVLMIIPFAVVYGAGKTAETVLECVINDYLTFIILLFGLFCVSGNITVEGDFAGSPRVNVGLLALGTLLSSCIGTTGASMLMVRPVIKMNSWRKRKGHIMIFFIFMVSNMGGCLTPLGDPPLFMGFQRGVPFTWTFHLLPILVLNLVLMFALFAFLDKHSHKQISRSLPHFFQAPIQTPLLTGDTGYNPVPAVSQPAACSFSRFLRFPTRTSVPETLPFPLRCKVLLLLHFSGSPRSFSSSVSLLSIKR